MAELGAVQVSICSPQIRTFSKDGGCFRLGELDDYFDRPEADLNDCYL